MELQMGRLKTTILFQGPLLKFYVNIFPECKTPSASVAIACLASASKAPSVRYLWPTGLCTSGRHNRFCLLKVFVVAALGSRVPHPKTMRCNNSAAGTSGQAVFHEETSLDSSGCPSDSLWAPFLWMICTASINELVGKDSQLGDSHEELWNDVGTC